MAALLDAHARLATCRTAQGEIPWTAIEVYARCYGIDDLAFLEDCVFGFERVHRAFEKMNALDDLGNSHADAR